MIRWSKWFVLVVLALLLAACAGPALTPTPTATLEPQPFTLTVLYTNDGWGYTEPCACDPAVGGLARRATYIKAVRAETENVLVVDAGDSLLALQRVGDREQGLLLADAFNEMGYDAVALGGLDFRMGFDVLREQVQVADYAVLSANTFDPQTNKPFDQAYTIVEMQGHRIAIIGVTDAVTASDVTGGALPVTEPVETLLYVVDEVRDEVDVIIVLSHLGMMFDINLNQVIPGLDLIVSGRDKEVYDPPLTAAGPVIVSAGSRGEYIGRVDLQLDAEGNVLSVDGEMQQLSDEVADDPEMRQWMAQSGLIAASALKSGTEGEVSP